MSFHLLPFTLKLFIILLALWEQEGRIHVMGEIHRKTSKKNSIRPIVKPIHMAETSEEHKVERCVCIMGYIDTLQGTLRENACREEGTLSPGVCYRT